MITRLGRCNRPLMPVFDLAEYRFNVVGDGYSTFAGVGDRNRGWSDFVPEVCLNCDRRLDQKSSVIPCGRNMRENTQVQQKISR
jgi:hypothetical protein